MIFRPVPEKHPTPRNTRKFVVSPLSLTNEWVKIADQIFAHCLPPHFSSRLFCPALFWLVGKRRDKNGQQKWSAIHSLISEWKRRDDKLSSIYWRTRFLLRHTQRDDRLATAIGLSIIISSHFNQFLIKITIENS